MDRDVLFGNLRSNVFGGSLTTDQVKGVEALLDACSAEQVADGRSVSYILATPMIETGGRFLPIVESLNYAATALTAKFGSRISHDDAFKYGRTGSQPADQKAIANLIYGGAWGVQNLGNTQAGDGWAYRGRGLCQVTGRNNYAKFERLLGLPLTASPDLAAQLDVAAKIMVVGMRDGLFTGKKLGDYFTPKVSDWVNARRIINGLDRANNIANYAKKIFAAVKAAA